MKFTQSVALTSVAIVLTACSSGAPSGNTVRELIEKDGIEVAKSQARSFRPRSISDDEIAKIADAYRGVFRQPSCGIGRLTRRAGSLLSNPRKLSD